MDPFTLSSSPLHTAGDKTPPSTLKLIMSSSPALPSLSQLIAGKTALKTNQSPRSTNIGFSSARDLLGELNKEKGPSTPLFDDSLILESDIRVSDSNDEVSEPDCMKEQAPENVDKRPPPKGRCKSGTSSKSTISPHFSGSRLSPQQNEKPDGSDSKEKSKNPRKANQTKITNTKVRKPGICAVSEKKAKATDERQGLAKVGSKASKATKSSKSCEEARDLEVKDLTLSAEVEQGLGLVEAIKRRQSWTPVKNTSNRPDTPTEHAVACSALSPRESPNLGELNEPRFEMLLGAFACSKIDRIESAAFHVPRNQTGEAITKRRKVGLVTSNTSSIGRLNSEKGGRSPKKKSQTITEKATAPFISDNQIGISTLLDYFASPVAPQVTSLPFLAQGKQVKPRKSTQKSRPKPKKVDKELVKLHSPECALMAAREQDLLFGTSSQLAREESPEFIRTLQQAIKESETYDGSQTVSQGGESQFSAQSIASTGSSIRQAAASRNLWSAAARDNAGLLHDVDVVDLVDTPQAPRVRPKHIKSTDQQVPLKPIDHAIDEGRKGVEGVTALEIPASLAVEQDEAPGPLPRSIAEASLRQRPKSKSPVKKDKLQGQGPAAKSQDPEMPNYDGFTDIDLRKAVTAFGFRSKQKREHLIALLKECWESKNRKALQSLPPNISAPLMPTKLGSEIGPQASGSPKKRGRPSKGAVVDSALVEANVASAAFPKRPRGRPRKEVTEGSSRKKKQAKTSPQEMVTKGQEVPVEAVSKPADEPSEPSRGRNRGSSQQSDQLISTSSRSMKLSDSEVKALFATITKAIKRTKPTHDAKNLTWYEKILLYDPIVLEDLADWLNKEGLARVQCVTMVTPLLVKQWCESQSICCLWKENLRGGTRARY